MECRQSPVCLDQWGGFKDEPSRHGNGAVRPVMGDTVDGGGMDSGFRELSLKRGLRPFRVLLLILCAA
jgi:hypothetical protein